MKIVFETYLRTVLQIVTVLFFSLSHAISAGFTENKGQLMNDAGKPADNVFFKLSSNNVDVFVTDFGLRYAFMREKTSFNLQNVSQVAEPDFNTKKDFEMACVDMVLIGANFKKENIIAENDITEGNVSYYLGHCPNGIFNVKTYSKITFKNVYANIDWVIYLTSDSKQIAGFKYDFVVHPGGDVNNIAINYKGNGAMLGAEQNLYIQTQLGSLEDKNLYCYYQETGEKVSCAFKTKNSTENIINGFSKLISFDVNKRVSKTLVIDPQLTWGTMFGVDKWTVFSSCFNDQQSNLFVTGYSNSSNYPVLSAGTYFNGSYTGTNTITVITKFSSTGQLLWSTYYGGTNPSGYTWAETIKCDSYGNVWVLGFTNDETFPTQNAGGYFDNIPNNSAGVQGPNDAYILKFDNAGNRFWASYLGGTNIDYGVDIAFDSQQNIFLSIGTNSTNFPTMALGAYNKTASGSVAIGGDWVIMKFDNATNLLWSSYMGFSTTKSSGRTYVSPHIAVDYLDNLFVAGSTNQETAPLLNAGTYFDNTFSCSSCTGGFPDNDGFIMKFDNNNNQLWGTYFKNSGNDYTNMYGAISDIAVNSNGDLYIVGQIGSFFSSSSNPLPVLNSGGYYDPTFSGSSAPYADAFIARFSNSGVQKWTSYYGGTGAAAEHISEIVIDDCDYVHLTGNTYRNSIDLKQDCSNSYYDNASTYYDILYAVFSPTDNLVYATLLGGNDEGEDGGGISIDKNKNVYIVGQKFLGSAPFSGTAAGCVNPGGGAYFNDNWNTTTYDGKGYIAKFSPTPLKTSVSQTNIVGCSCTGDATINVCGIAPYSYTWSNGSLTNSTLSTSNTISALCAAQYKVTITDSWCNKDSATYIITSTSGYGINATLQDPGCGLSDGKIDITISSGLANYTYTWSNGSSSATGTSTAAIFSISGLAAGTYTVTVADAAACSIITNVILANSSAPVINSITPTDILCNGNATGSAVVNATGSGVLSYAWSGSGSTGATAAGLSAGNYTVTVSDGSGCTSTSTISITEPLTITTPTISTADASCGNNSGSANAIAAGGTGVLIYVWSNGFTGATNNNLASGNYVVTVTDANSCTKTAAAIVGNSSGPSVQSISTTTLSCSGDSNGTASVTISGGSVPYIYSWSNGASVNTSAFSNSISSLLAGTYSVTITDNAGCSATSSANITEPAAIVFAVPTATVATCGVSNGSASVSATGGTGSLNYSWSDNTAGQTISGVTAGTYTVSVTDANSCLSTTAVLINNNPSATIDSVITTGLTCKNSGNGSAIAYATGGTGMLTYSWSNATSGQTISNVSAATYVISVTDASGCLTQSNVQVTQPNAITVLSANANSSTCENNNGSADIMLTGGTGAYTYTWSSGQSGVTAIGNLSSGIYTLTVTDANSCTYTHTFTIGNKPSPRFTSSSPVITPVDCKGNNSASVIVVISDGTSPYTYLWSSGPSSVTTAASDTLSNLPAGNYTISVTDNNGCLVDTTIAISEPAFMFTTLVTSNNGTCLIGGDASATVSGGNSGMYTYSWSNGASSVTNYQVDQITNLASNTYSVTVTDSKGCTTVSTASVSVPGGITASLSAFQNISCFGNSDGSATVTTTVGSSPYTYTWSGGASSSTSSLTHQVNNLTANSYTVTVTDNLGCSSTQSLIITEPAILNAVPNTTDATCGNNNGSIFITASGGTSQYTYTWNNGSSGATISALAAGNYSVTLTDSKNCTTTTNSIIISLPLPIAGVSATATSITTGSSVNLSGSGGVNYSWSPSGSLSCNPRQNPSASPTETTTYTLVATDVNNCQDTATITIKVKEIPNCTNESFLPAAFSPNNDGQNDILYVRGISITAIDLTVFDRWGEKVFETSDAAKGWDGSFKGEQMDTGVYVYYLKGTCVKTGDTFDIKGNLVLLK